MSLMRKVCSPVLWIILAAAVVGCRGGGGGEGAAPTAPSQDESPDGVVNAPPRITGQPGSVVLPNQTYTFQPAASDPDGDKLTFSAQNLPQWLTLNTSSGRISGTPSETDIGTYSGITIRVSDGLASATLGPFTITVSGGAASGAATLSWQPPTENSDGSTLTDLAGYEIRYGQDADDLSEVISLDNPALNIYVVENLSSGTWYFAVSAVNSAGIASELSAIVSKTIS